MHAYRPKRANVVRRYYIFEFKIHLLAHKEEKTCASTENEKSLIQKLRSKVKLPRVGHVTKHPHCALNQHLTCMGASVCANIFSRLHHINYCYAAAVRMCTLSSR